MKTTKSELRQIIKEEIAERNQRQQLDEAIPAVLVGAAAVTALTKKGGRKLIGKALRLTADFITNFEEIDDRIFAAAGIDPSDPAVAIIDEITELVADLAFGRKALLNLADTLEGITPDESKVLKQVISIAKPGLGTVSALSGKGG